MASAVKTTTPRVAVPMHSIEGDARMHLIRWAVPAKHDVPIESTAA
jgi:hypothetical protein